MIWRIAILILISLLWSCKKDIAGCDDIEALNWNPKATLNDKGKCIYPGIIYNPNFELDDDGWGFVGGPNMSYSMWVDKTNDGFMPTSGRGYLKCIPYYNKSTSAIQYISLPNKHFKGLLFDYEIFAEANKDSILDLSAGLGGYFNSSKNQNLWAKYIKESPKSFGGFPKVHIMKKNEYFAFPTFTASNSNMLIIGSNIYAGTFTFCIDNIREVKNY